MAIQKIIKVGNSYALTIPKSFVDSLNVTTNHTVKVKADEENGKLEADFLTTNLSQDSVIDPEVYKVAKDLLARYLPAFKELAEK